MYIPIPALSDESLYIRIYRSIREDCLSGLLRPGDRLPSRRKLARELGVAVNTVDGAYQQLVSEGYVESVPRSGFVVRPLFKEDAQGGKLGFLREGNGAGRGSFTDEGCNQGTDRGSGNTESEGENTENELIDFSPNGVDLSALPIHDLRKLIREVFSSDPKVVFGGCDPKGHPALRAALCRYLAVVRGIGCSPDRIVIGAGTDYVLQYLIRLLRLAVNMRAIATENPVYNKAIQIFTSLGETVVPLPLDDQGLIPEALRACPANIAYVTPSHQFPLGIVMPAGRRADLLSWASDSADRYIIEDDYDSEFRYSGRPVPPLFAMAKADKVIYLGTFSKSVAPSLRISYLVLPEVLSGISRNRMAFFNTTVSVPDQLVLARFLETGLFERHINRMRTLYRRKKDVLVRELSSFQTPPEITGTDAGMHLICSFRDGPGETELVERAAHKGVRVYGISDYFSIRGIRDPSAVLRIPESTVLLGYGAPDADTIVRGCRLLREAWNR